MAAMPAASRNVCPPVVFNGGMKRFLPAVAAVAALTPALAAAPASATVVELGASTTNPLIAPTCPPGVSSANCRIILTQVTALETLTGGAAYPTTIKKAGYLVAFTVGLSRLDKNLTTATSAVHYLNTAYGGPPRAGLTVLGISGPKKNRNFKVLHRSPQEKLQPFLGQVAQFPIRTPIPVVAGQVVALTTSTWAPVLSFDLPNKQYAYRQSRNTACGNAATNNAQTQVNQVAQYACNYGGTRVEYSVTEVTTPVPPKTQIK